MSGDGTYRVELEYMPDNPPLVWVARIYDDTDGTNWPAKQTVWGTTRDTALLHARQWVKSRDKHGGPETVLLDRNGDLIEYTSGYPDITEPHGFSEKGRGMSEPLRMRVTLEGPARTVTTNYGEREERDTLATLDVPIEATRGWGIYQGVVKDAVAPVGVITFPSDMSAEEAGRIRAEWTTAHERDTQ